MKLVQHIKKHKIKYGILTILLLIYALILPAELFPEPTSSVIEDNEGNLIGARIAEDGQWRFPHNDSIPFKFKEAIINFEDKNFYYHPGVDLLATARAAYLNVKSGKNCKWRKHFDNANHTAFKKR